MDPRKEQLTQYLAQMVSELEALTTAAAAGNRALTDEEQTKFDTAKANAEKTKKELQNLADLEALKAIMPAPRIVKPEHSDPTATTKPLAPPARSPITGEQVNLGFPNHGFEKGLGEFLNATRAAVISGKVDPRLMVNAVTTWAGETVGADGGFALPPQFVQGIMSLVAAEDSFIRALNAYPTSSDIITIPKDEDAPWSTTAITAAKTAEGTAITGSKPSIGQLKVPMYGIKALVHVDEKSLRDMAFLAAYVERKMGEKIRWKVENYVMNGTGENEPLGILNAPGLLALTDVNSTATVLGAEDIMNMEALSLMGPGGFWIAHPTVLQQLRTLKSGSGGYPLYTVDFRTQSPGGGLLTYPVYKSFAGKPLNTTGDILFVKPDGYFLAFEQGGPMNATTISFAFDQNLQSFRSTLYMGGAPTLAAKVLLPDATTYVSNLVALAGSRT